MQLSNTYLITFIEWTTAVDEMNRPVSTSPVILACWRLVHYDV